MMAFMMPVIFGFIHVALRLGPGALLGHGNLINLAIQLAINQSSMGKEMHAIAARRAAKRKNRRRSETDIFSPADGALGLVVLSARP
jgi:hypothetical protein